MFQAGNERQKTRKEASVRPLHDGATRQASRVVTGPINLPCRLSSRLTMIAAALMYMIEFSHSTPDKLLWLTSPAGQGTDFG